MPIDIMYQDRIGNLCENLQSEDDDGAAVDVLRSRLDEISLVPQNGELFIVLPGDLRAILRFAAGQQNPDFRSIVGCGRALWTPLTGFNWLLRRVGCGGRI
ncbi:hypothetical protein [Rhodovulum sp. P5]|uniref:hypothetical protein n=1 Tax=Rhodovulum sp. P5 TaxID=1564506 RepID=UPI0009DB2C5E|nr:hypothetical protein [Rhodovulum sp. P5]